MLRKQTISVVIPTLNAEEAVLEVLLRMLWAQTLPPDEILVLDSSSEDNTLRIADSLGAHTIVISPQEFDHGATRHQGLLAADGDFVCFMTQDAMPANDRLIENLVAPLEDHDIAATYARQLAPPRSSRYVELVQSYNYPAKTHVRSIDDIDTMDIKAFFFSNVCAAYRRSDYLELGGFTRPIETNEDMLMCSRLLHEHKRIAYVADACVYHANELTLLEQFRRDRAIGRFLTLYTDELDNRGELGEGSRMARSVASALLRERRVKELASFSLRCLVRLVGNRVGRIEGGIHTRSGEYM